MNLDAAIQTFIAESRELLESMEDTLLRLESTPGDPDLINGVFRAAHTIKGSAGVFGFDPIVAFTHQVESLLDKMREGVITPSADLVALLLGCGDHIGALIEPVTKGDDPSGVLLAQGQALLERLGRYLTSEAPSRPLTERPTPQVDAVEVGERGATAEHWHISLRFSREVLRNGMDPLAFLRYLTTLGDIVHITTLVDAMPDAAEVDPEVCYLDFEVSFKSEADKAAIENVFEFVRDDCLIRILPPRSKVSEYIRHIEELPEDTLKLGELLVKSGALTQSELEWGLRLQSEEATRRSPQAGDDTPPVRPLGAILVQEHTVDACVVTAALEKQQQVKEHRAQESRAIRVDAEKLDGLIDLVGELVIAGAGTQLLARRAGLTDLAESTTTLSRLVEEVRNSALGLRMVAIGSTFQRFQRVVRDVSRELGKDIDLVISGGETELDKSVVEKIADPLMHLVRNAMDHGIEPVDARIAAGKPTQAKVALDAYHDSGSIVIEVADDGAGLNREKILKKALERGLVTAAQTLSDSEVFNLIFEPGFSTADTLSNLSGRGVGMDVVRRNVQGLRGTIQLESEPGRSTTVRLRLPLTLAIIDGFLVSVGQSHYVIPLDMVVECLEHAKAQGDAVTGCGYLDLRGEVLPVVRLKELFAVEGPATARENIVVVRFGELKAGFIVDALLGEFQTVIKPLGTLFGHLKVIGGSTILGSGEVVLILDVPSLIQHVVNTQSARLKAA